MRDRQICIGCGKKSPETETNYTLISSRFGWRLTRTNDATGKLVVAWRCASCWRLYKIARGETAPESTRVGPNVLHPASETRRAVPAATQDDDPTLREPATFSRKFQSDPPRGAGKR